MVSHRHELSDEELALLQSLLPATKPEDDIIWITAAC